MNMRKTIHKFRIAFIAMLVLSMIAFGSMLSFAASGDQESGGPSITIYQMFSVNGVEPAGLDKSFDYILTSDNGPLPSGTLADGYVFTLDNNGTDQIELTFTGDSAATGNHVVVFSHAGVYLYHLKLDENSIPEDDRYTVDQSEYNVKVFVKNDGNGGLAIERVFALESNVDPDNPSEDQKLSSITYNHRYAGDPSPCFIDPPVKKVITGDKPAKNETFYFTITAKQDQSTLPEGMTEMPMPEAANGQQSYTMSIVGEGEREFGEIWFTQPGKYVYEITENKGNADGYGYDKSVYTVIADVTMDANGNLHVAQTDKKGLFETDEIVFSNAYDEDGGEPNTGDEIRFKVTIGIMIAAAAAMVLLLFARRRRRNEEE